jgi:hypothetical protein
MNKKTGPKPPRWFSKIETLKNRLYTTTDLCELLADSEGKWSAPSHRALHHAFKRRGLKAKHRQEGANPENLWEGRKIKVFLIPRSGERPLF